MLQIRLIRSRRREDFILNVKMEMKVLRIYTHDHRFEIMLLTRDVRGQKRSKMDVVCLFNTLPSRFNQL